jgi:hypothetical protein
LRDNNELSNFKVTRKNDGSQARIRFKYAEKGQGVVVQVVHDCESGSDLEVTGVFMRAHELSRREVDVGSIRGRKFRRMFFAVLSVFFGVPCLVLLALNQILTGLTYGTLSAIMFLNALTLRLRVPEGLETLEGLFVESEPAYLTSWRRGWARVVGAISSKKS